MNNAVGSDALEFMDALLTPEEIAESSRRVALIGERIKARQKKGLSQKKPEAFIKKTRAAVPQK